VRERRFKPAEGYDPVLPPAPNSESRSGTYGADTIPLAVAARGKMAEDQ